MCVRMFLLLYQPELLYLTEITIHIQGMTVLCASFYEGKTIMSLTTTTTGHSTNMHLLTFRKVIHIISNYHKYVWKSLFCQSKDFS